MSESNVCPPTFLFLDEEGRPMEFIICHKNLEQRAKYTKIIEDRTGCVFSRLRDFGSHTIVLVEDDAKLWSHDRDVFKVSYIDECLKQESIIEIGKFIHYPSAELVPDFPYMDICYYRKFGWNNIPDKYKLAPLSSSSDDEEATAAVTKDNTNIPTEPNKRTRIAYTAAEKEAIIKYIVKHDLYTYMKGVAIWRDMEQANICPRRTWQSMKEHTLKYSAKQLHLFKFLTPVQKNNLHLVLTSCPSSSDDEEATAENTNTQTERNKKTRMAYTVKEKEAIIKYIVQHDVYTYMKGVSIWRDMEQANICPRRTWQSMKEHTLKTLSKQLHLFRFLTPIQKNNLRLVFGNK